MHISSYLNNREREREEEGWRKNNLEVSFFPFFIVAYSFLDNA